MLNEIEHAITLQGIEKLACVQRNKDIYLRPFVSVHLTKWHQISEASLIVGMSQ